MQIKVKGTYPEIKKAIEYTNELNAESRGYEELKDYLFKKYENDTMSNYKRQIKADYKRNKENNPKLVGDEKIVKTNPFALIVPKKKKKKTKKVDINKDLLEKDSTKNIKLK